MMYESSPFGHQHPERHANSLLKKSIVQRQCPVCRKFRCPLKSHQAFVRRLRKRHDGAPVRQLSEEKVDPFAKHPIIMTPEYERLYAQGWQRWNSDFKGPERHLFPYSRYSAVLRNAWHDVALHYGILSVIATQISKLRSGLIDETALELQGKAISAQTRALQGDQLSDARVMTALCIMSNAFATNKQDDLTVHLALIGASLRQRGGLQYLGMDGIIADNLMYADHTRAVISNDKPHYQVHTPPVPLKTALVPSPVYTDLCLKGLLSQEVATAASNYQILVTLFEKAARGRGTPSEATYFFYFANVVEFQLTNANERFHDTNTIDECLVLACLVSNHTLLRNYGQLSPVVQILEARLWKCLTYLREHDHLLPYGLHDLEVYLVCLCTITSIRKPSPFEHRVIDMLAQTRKKSTCPVHTFHELCDVMERYGWSELVCLTLYARLWNKSSDMVMTAMPMHNAFHTPSN